MKKAYRKPMAKMVNYSYDEQVVAGSQTKYCDQGWTRMTTLKPQMRTTYCDRCESDLIWIDSTSPW